MRTYLRIHNFFRLLGMLVMIATGKMALAQPFNNEWIDFSKTYYKFKVGADGMYRITAAALNANGLGNIPVEQLRMYRNGEEVPFYTSVPTGPLPSNGYIEFIGFANDGVPDRELYRDPQFQHRTKYSLHADTAIYFLTIEPNQPNKRFITRDNDVANNTLAPEPYFIYKLAKDFKERINPGFAADLEQYVYSSSYDRGEIWSSNEIRQRLTRSETQSNLRVAPEGPDATLEFGAFGNTVKTRRVRLEVNGSNLYEGALNFFNDMVTTVNVPISLISGGSATVAFTNVQPPAPPTGTDPYLDRMVISFYELTYPRQFNFNNTRFFSFELEPKTSGHYLEITNFNAGNAAPILYDLENHERYVANTQVSGVFRFALPGTANKRRLVMVGQVAASNHPYQVTTFTPKTFTDFRQPALQGNYLMISHKQLFGGSSGNNAVEDYRDYRRSTAGGGYNAQIYDIEELTDQFAFGIFGHPLSVRNFVRFAQSNFSQPIQYVLLVGKGVAYNSYRASANVMRPRITELNLVPTFGYPGSDNMLCAVGPADPRLTVPVGRISVLYPAELETYLEKVKEFEQVRASAPHTIEGRAWMKNALHVTGATDALLGTQLCNYMQSFARITADTFAGYKTTVFCSSAGNPANQSQVQVIRNMFSNGLALLNYFGHSSASTLEFNIEEPEVYNNKGKYPVFSVNGCYAGDLFTYSDQRFGYIETLSEKYVLAKQKGAIAFIASTHFGIVNYLSAYLVDFNTNLSVDNYGASIGLLNQESISDMLDRFSPIDFLARCHAEQLGIHGDPALRMYQFDKPDYVIEEPYVEINPQFISVAEQEFDLKIRYFNIGKATNDSINVKVTRILPNGTRVVIYNERRLAPKNDDTIQLKVPINPTTDKGNNRIEVVLDDNDEIQEEEEGNNSIVKTVFIYEDEVTPVYPQKFSIVNNASQKFYASTANPFSEPKRYYFELDTTATFDSPFKVALNTQSSGGLLEFSPQVNYTDSTVYYWRTAIEEPAGVEMRWSTSSFQYISNSSDGFGQAHVYQHTESESNRISIDTVSRKWKFDTKVNSLTIRNGVYPTAASLASEFAIHYNGNMDIASVCGVSGIIFNVFDPITFLPWFNAMPGEPSRFGSDDVCGADRRFNFQYNILDPVKRKAAMDFLRSIPSGYFVVVRNISGTAVNTNTYAEEWKADTAQWGSGNSLYHALAEQGALVDSFDRPRSFIFVYRKDRITDFPVVSKFSDGTLDKINITLDCLTEELNASISSPVVGPAKAWTEFTWRGNTEDPNPGDSAVFEIRGVAVNGSETILHTVPMTTSSVDLSSVNAADFPYMRVVMRNIDSTYGTPYQLRRWHITYQSEPEGAVAPNLFWMAKDTLELGETLNFGVAFKNISAIDFDSVKAKLVITDQSNTQHEIPLSMLKPLAQGDTIKFSMPIDTRKFAGTNTLYFAFNPENHQPEQQFVNNFLYHSFYVRPDKYNPLLDVTFDGVHILNGDIVSAKPHIEIKLKDEARYMLLDDTSLLSVKVRFPDGSIKTYKVDNDTLRFQPASADGKNTAVLHFYPAFLTTYSEDGMDSYELYVTGKDLSDNTAGNKDYSVNFMVINKPMISNLLNYPNPFTTSTAFVFTITGSEIPTNFKIQILTITGKVVREITALELGPLRIGRNITEYKWDGTDQYGQRLANGVYLYRVVSTLNGKRMDKFRSQGENTDKYFTKGYGKMYLMR